MRTHLAFILFLPIVATFAQTPPLLSSEPPQFRWARNMHVPEALGEATGQSAAVDAAGNVYVVGSASTQTGLDYLVIKYDGAGREVWRAMYDGPAHEDDLALHAIVDNTGNLVVTGMSASRRPEYSTWSSSYDFCTIKYSPGGARLWVARFNGPTHSTDIPTAIAADVWGNIVVAGESENGISSMNIQCAAVKYDANGNQQWVVFTPGGESGDRRLPRLVLDQSGNVWIAGFERGDSHSKVLLARYDSHGRETLLDSTGVPYTYGAVAALKTDGRNLYAAVSGGNTHNGQSNILVVKWSAEGVCQWVKEYRDSSLTMARATSLTIQANGDIVVGGVAGKNHWGLGHGDAVLILKFTDVGELRWARKFFNREGLAYENRGLVMDTEGQLIVGATLGVPGSSPFEGRRMRVLRVDAAGTLLWFRDFSAQDYSLSLGSVLVAGGGEIVLSGTRVNDSGSELMMMKLTAGGMEMWRTTSCTEATLFQKFGAMTVDCFSDLVVAVSTLQSNGGASITTAKFSPDGRQQWVMHYRTDNRTFDHPNAVATDRAGNAYVAGTSSRFALFETILIKYNRSGREEWVARLPVTGSWTSPFPLSVQVDGRGRVFVQTGKGVARFSASGTMEWIYNGTYINDMQLTPEGNAYCSTSDGVVSLDSVGRSRLVVAPPVRSLALHPNGDIYVTDASSTARYRSDGSRLWAAPLGGRAITVDANGNAIVERYWTMQEGPFMSFSSNGHLLWQMASHPFTRHITGWKIDARGDLLVLGNRDSRSGLSYDAMTQAYSLTGARKFELRYASELGHSIIPQSVACDSVNNMYVACTQHRRDYSSTVTILKYSPSTATHLSTADEQRDFRLDQNYPNPFNPHTTIQFRIPEESHIKLEVFDIIGRNVGTLVDERRVAGPHRILFDASHLSSGVYVYKLTSGSLTSSRKFLLMR